MRAPTALGELNSQKGDDHNCKTDAPIASAGRHYIAVAAPMNEFPRAVCEWRNLLNNVAISDGGQNERRHIQAHSRFSYSEKE